MKVFAIGSIVKPVSDEHKKEIMPKEVPATLKHYLDGKIEQIWSRQDAPGVIFLMNVAARERRLREIRSLAGRPARAVGPADPGQVSAGGASTS
jgi:hypothetical protein